MTINQIQLGLNEIMSQIQLDSAQRQGLTNYNLADAQYRPQYLAQCRPTSRCSTICSAR